MALITLPSGVIPGEGLTDYVYGLVNQINANATLSGQPYSVLSYASTATLTATSSTTLATATGLTSTTLVAGGTYQISGMLQGTAAASGGIKAALVASSGLTVTSLNVTGINYNGTTINAQTNVTALGSDFSSSSAVYTNLYFSGSFVVNAAGVLNVQAAQNTSNASSTTVVIGSYFNLIRIS